MRLIIPWKHPLIVVVLCQIFKYYCFNLAKGCSRKAEMTASGVLKVWETKKKRPTSSPAPSPTVADLQALTWPELLCQTQHDVAIISLKLYNGYLRLKTAADAASH